MHLMERRPSVSCWRNFSSAGCPALRGSAGPAWSLSPRPPALWLFVSSPRYIRPRPRGPPPHSLEYAKLKEERSQVLWAGVEKVSDGVLRAANSRGLRAMGAALGTWERCVWSLGGDAAAPRVENRHSTGHVGYRTGVRLRGRSCGHGTQAARACHSSRPAVPLPASAFAFSTHTHPTRSSPTSASAPSCPVWERRSRTSASCAATAAATAQPSRPARRCSRVRGMPSGSARVTCRVGVGPDPTTPGF